MKKNLILLPFLLAVTIFSVAARPIEEPTVQQAFQKQFVGADNVRWSDEVDGFRKVSFTWASHRMEAYFDHNAEFVGAVRGIFYEQLPLTVIRSIDETYKKPVVLEVREITNKEGTSYSVLLEKKGKKVRVHVDNAGGIMDEVREKK